MIQSHVKERVIISFRFYLKMQNRFYLYFNYYNDNMSTPAKSNRNLDTVADSETIFDFLKRKKFCKLEATLNKSSAEKSKTKRKYQPDIDDDYPQMRSATSKTNHNYFSYREPSKTSRPKQTLTPTKLNFAQKKHTATPNTDYEHELHKHPSFGRNFLNMISPIKRENESRLEEKENSFRSNKNGKDLYTRKKIKQTIEFIKLKVNKANQKLKGVKEKSHTLVIVFNNFFNKVIQDLPETSRQVGELRNRLKSFENYFDQESIEEINEALEGFHKEIEDHLEFTEGNCKKQFERSKEQQLISVRNQKQYQIDKLEHENKKLKHQIQSLKKKLEKSECEVQKVEERLSERELNLLQKIQNLQKQHLSSREELQTKIQTFQQQFEKLSLQYKQNKEQLKQSLSVIQKLKSSHKEQLRQILQSKDSYLLNQIMVLKAQFSADITRISQLHKIRQTELLTQLLKTQESIKKQQFQRNCDRTIQLKVVEQANTLKSQNTKLKSKNQCIISDMCRMNEQLFQHWLALKDIKMLSTRLGNFATFKKIYDDLIFNETLFS